MNNLPNEKTSEFYDFTIIGAGAAGLWLAISLLEHDLLKNKTLCIIENDANKGNDRTWCFWADQQLIPNHLISKTWTAIYNPFYNTVRNQLNPYVYNHIRSEDFYSKSKEILNKCSNVFWINDEFESFNEKKQLVMVKTIKAQFETKRLFISSLPKVNSGTNNSSELDKFLGTNKSRANLFLWQSFVGWRIKTQNPSFDDTCATMMRFDIAQQNSTQFLYVLPFSNTEALIEITRFGEEKLSLSSAEIALKEYLTNNNIEYEKIEEEIGAIPMTTKFDMQNKKLDAQTKIIYIGTPGGALKPTSGYAFKRIFNYSKQLAFAIKNNTELPTMYRHWRFQLYDHLLLRILKHHPEQGKGIFERLFETQPVKKVFRFLDEETNIWEEISIFSRLPIRLFMNSLFNYLRYR